MKALFLVLAMLVSPAALSTASATVLPPHCDPWIAPNPHPTPTPPPTGADDFTSLPRPTPVPVPAEEPSLEAYGPCPQETPPPQVTPTPTPVPSDPPATEEPVPTDDPNQVVDPGSPVIEGSGLGCSLNAGSGFSGDVGALVGLGFGLLSLRRRHRA